jgi:Xaa-Pro aminopeptidase
MSARVDALTLAVAERELDALLVSNLVNVRWLTGFTGSSALAVVGPTTRRFVTDFRYLTQAAEQLETLWEREIATELMRRAVEGLPAQRPLRLGFDDAHLTVKQHAQLASLVGEGVELVAAGGALEKLRAVKDAVLSEVEPALLERLGMFEVMTQAPDKRIFLSRPDLGRVLSDA